MLKKLLLLFTLAIVSFSQAQTLYWVGGSGYWNDVNHWSATSGGTSMGTVPDKFSNVVFDDNSVKEEDAVIHAAQNVEISSINSVNQSRFIKLIGGPSVTFKINAGVTLSPYFTFDFNGKIFLTPSQPEVYQFSQTIFKSELSINSQYSVGLGTIQSKSKLIFTGNFILSNSIITASDVVFSNADVSLSNTTLYSKNSFFLNNSNLTNSGNNVNRLIASKDNLSASQITSLTNSGLIIKTPVPQTCTATLLGSTNPTCRGLCNGTATVSLAGCSNPPYDIQWLNADFSSIPCQTLPPVTIGYTGATFSVNTLCGCGTQYALLITNSNVPAEQFVVNVGIVDPPSTLISFTSTQPTCNGLCNGEIRANVISGIAPLVLNWNPPGVNHVNIISRDTLKNICAGIYTISATNFNGCVNTFTTTLNQPAVLLANGSSNSVTCNGVCNGSATITATGGTAPYTYVWSPSAVTASVNPNLCIGVITSTVTDAKNCQSTYSTTIIQPPAITLTVTKSDLLCGSVCDGAATIGASGGSGAGFTYSWTPNVSSSASASALCAGNYTVTVADNLNCAKTITFAITSPPTLVTAPTQTNIACNGVCMASINMHPSGGTGAYTYSWSPSVSTASAAVNLCAGPYTFTVTDALGCKAVNSATITQPPALALTITKTNVTCNGVCNGSATANITGGTAPYTYTWSPGTPAGQGTNVITGLCPGTYTLNAKDANNCAITSTVVITEPTAIVANVSFIQPSCNGLCDGVINSFPTGGTGPYTYTLLATSGAPVVSSPPFGSLCAGSYTLLVQDANTCIKTETINLTQPNPIVLTLNASPINCFNLCNATISTVVNGGTPDYSYQWSTGSTSSAIINQCTGVYSATVTDAGGCIAVGTVTITSPPDINVAIAAINPNCNGQCTGIASTTVTGGTPNYTINWNNGTVGNVNFNLCAGNYTAIVTDALGCVKTETIAIIAPPPLVLSSTSGTVSCAGSCDGIISVTPTGGTAGYFYSWSSTPAQTTQTATALCPGTYVASVTDSKGCIASIAATVSQPSVLTGTIGNVLPSCNICIGAATATGLGGTPPYSYLWAPGSQTTGAVSDLCVGPQTVTITDSRGCVSTQTVFINQTVVVLVTTNGATLTCNGGCSGIATANPSGGLAPYTYTWTPAPIQNTQTASSLCAGSHTIVVADVNGCATTDIVTFFDPPAINLTVNQTDVSCNGLCNGTASASATGGTGPINYIWQPGGFLTPTLSGLCPGIYTVTAFDGNACSQTQTVSIQEPALLTTTFTPVSPSTCTSSDGSISFTATGGVGPYSFTWTPSGTSANPLINISDGIYVLNLSDANGCQISFTTTLNDPFGPTVSVISNSITCYTQCTGSASLSISGVAPFSVNWPSVPSTSISVGGLCAGSYIAQVADNNGCVTNQSVSIVQSTAIVSTGITTNATCNSVCSASINLSPSGGTPPYTYSWLPAGGSSQDPINLCAGSYSVIITDVNSCSATNTFTVTEPSPLALVFNKKDVLCNGGCTGGARVVASGGTFPYTYSWVPAGPFTGSSLDTIVNLCTGTYSVTVFDANGCSLSGTVSIGEPAVLTSTITSVDIKCNGQCNGSAVIIATGGTLPYSFAYNTTPPILTSSIGGLCGGTYVGKVVDANGCASANTFSISQPSPIVITTTKTNPKCNAACDGSVLTTVAGGNPAYHYNWVPAGGAVANPTGLCAGNYTLTVTDDSLCTGIALVALTDPPLLIGNISSTNPNCSTGCTGVLTSNPIGGATPFNYAWAPLTATVQTVTNLCPGSYTLTLTDANGCQDVQMATLVAPPSLSVNPAVTPSNCGFSNGSINAVPFGGTPNYTYNWPAPVSSTSQTVTGLAAGIYTVIVTDAASCTASISITLNNSNGPTGATLTSTNVTCYGSCNGAAEISNPVGGTPGYVLSWTTPSSPTSIVTGLCAGNYVSLVTDANNCLFFQTVAITEPQVIDDNESITGAACLGSCNGMISVAPTGGNGGYTYLWSNSTSNSTATGLCPGTVSLTITDSQNCTSTSSYTVFGLTTVTTDTFVTDNLCFSDCNGTALATNVAGGLPPYSFLWTDPLGQSSAQSLGLCTGNYSVTITDGNGCFGVFPVLINSPGPVLLNPAVTQPGCGLCDGSAVVNPTGGVPSYSYVWSNTQTSNIVSNLCAGLYMVQVTDGNGCQSNTSVVINSSSGITSESITFTNETCESSCDGTAAVTAIGGTAPITYNWLHNGSSASSVTGLCSGTYYCNMTDANGCSRTASVVIGSVSTFSITSQVTQSSCTANTGSITVNVTGGSGTYTLSWLPAGSTATITNLAPGTYTLIVADANGCAKQQVYSVGTVNGPIITSAIKEVSCTTGCDGSIGLSISGGTPLYSVAWSTSASTPTIGGLCPGNYSVQVTDAAGCKAFENFSLANATPIVFSLPALNNPNCHNVCDGSLTAIPSGGNLPYTFSWNPTGVTAPTASNLCANTYTVIVTDVNGCQASSSYSLSNPAAIMVTAVVTDASCNTSPDGSINVTVSGGIPAYTYSWTSGASTEDLINILSGTYSVSILDANLCQKDTSFTVNANLVVHAIAGNDTTFCQNSVLVLDGSPSSGGTTYEWYELPLTTPISNTTIVTVTPATGTSTYVLVATNNACIDRDTVIVNSNPLPIVDAGPFVSIPLYSSSPIGGSPTGPSGSTVSWFPSGSLDNPTSSNPTASNTITTIYTVTVIDANGCVNSDTVTVLIYPQIKIPNGFSPNGDGKNDTWMIDLIYQFPNCEVEVYNRWGEQLFYSKGYATSWNGQYKNKDLPVGTYYYIIKLNHPAYPDGYTGPLTIFR